MLELLLTRQICEDPALGSRRTPGYLCSNEGKRYPVIFSLNFFPIGKLSGQVDLYDISFLVEPNMDFCKSESFPDVLNIRLDLSEYDNHLAPSLEFEQDDSSLKLRFSVIPQGLAEFELHANEIDSNLPVGAITNDDPGPERSSWSSFWKTMRVYFHPLFQKSMPGVIIPQEDEILLNEPTKRDFSSSLKASPISISAVEHENGSQQPCAEMSHETCTHSSITYPPSLTLGLPLTPTDPPKSTISPPLSPAFASSLTPTSFPPSQSPMPSLIAGHTMLSASSGFSVSPSTALQPSLSPPSMDSNHDFFDLAPPSFASFHEFDLYHSSANNAFDPTRAGAIASGSGGRKTKTYKRRSDRHGLSRREYRNFLDAMKFVGYLVQEQSRVAVQKVFGDSFLPTSKEGATETPPLTLVSEAATPLTDNPGNTSDITEGYATPSTNAETPLSTIANSGSSEAKPSQGIGFFSPPLPSVPTTGLSFDGQCLADFEDVCEQLQRDKPKILQQMATVLRVFCATARRLDLPPELLLDIALKQSSNFSGASLMSLLSEMGAKEAPMEFAAEAAADENIRNRSQTAVLKDNDMSEARTEFISKIYGDLSSLLQNLDLIDGGNAKEEIDMQLLTPLMNCDKKRQPQKASKQVKKQHKPGSLYPSSDSYAYGDYDLSGNYGGYPSYPAHMMPPGYGHDPHRYGYYYPAHLHASRGAGMPYPPDSAAVYWSGYIPADIHATSPADAYSHWGGGGDINASSGGSYPPPPAHVPSSDRSALYAGPRPAGPREPTRGYPPAPDSRSSLHEHAPYPPQPMHHSPHSPTFTGVETHRNMGAHGQSVPPPPRRGYSDPYNREPPTLDVGTAQYLHRSAAPAAFLDHPSPSSYSAYSPSLGPLSEPSLNAPSSGSTRYALDPKNRHNSQQTNPPHHMHSDSAGSYAPRTALFPEPSYAQVPPHASQTSPKDAYRPPLTRFPSLDGPESALRPLGSARSYVSASDHSFSYPSPSNPFLVPSGFSAHSSHSDARWFDSSDTSVDQNFAHGSTEKSKDGRNGLEPSASDPDSPEASRIVTDIDKLVHLGDRNFPGKCACCPNLPRNANGMYRGHGIGADSASSTSSYGRSGASHVRDDEGCTCAPSCSCRCNTVSALSSPSDLRMGSAEQSPSFSNPGPWGSVPTRQLPAMRPSSLLSASSMASQAYSASSTRPHPSQPPYLSSSAPHSGKVNAERSVEDFYLQAKPRNPVTSEGVNYTAYPYPSPSLMPPSTSQPQGAYNYPSKRHAAPPLHAGGLPHTSSGGSIGSCGIGPWDSFRRDSIGHLEATSSPISYPSPLLGTETQDMKPRHGDDTNSGYYASNPSPLAPSSGGLDY